VVQTSVHYDLVSGKLVVRSIKDAKNGPVVEWGAYSFCGIQDKYFAAVFLPHAEGPVETRHRERQRRGRDDRPASPWVARAPTVSPCSFGPKDLDILKKVSPKLEQVVRFRHLVRLGRPSPCS